MKDWLGVFLPLWAVGTVAWIIAGFVMVPESFRRPVLYSANGVWTTRGYDLVNIDWEVARALAIVLGPPIVILIVALTIVLCESLWGKQHPRKI